MEQSPLPFVLDAARRYVRTAAGYTLRLVPIPRVPAFILSNNRHRSLFASRQASGDLAPIPALPGAIGGICALMDQS